MLSTNEISNIAYEYIIRILMKYNYLEYVLCFPEKK